MMKTDAKKLYGRDVVYILDFIVNLVLSVLIMMFYKDLYLKTGSADFMYEVIMRGNGIPLIAGGVSIVTAFIEIMYGVFRIKGKTPDEIGVIKQWAMMWVAMKCLALVLAVIVSVMGVDLKGFLM